jgi:hypothetical protein
MAEARKVARAQDQQAKKKAQQCGTNVDFSPTSGEEESTPIRLSYSKTVNLLNSDRREVNKSDESVIRPAMIVPGIAKKRSWTTTEDFLLYQLVMKYHHLPDPTIWSVVSGGSINGSTLLRCAVSCTSRWRVLSPPLSYRKGRWTKEEELRLQEAIWEQFEGKYQVIVDGLIGKPVTTQHNLAAFRPELVQVPGQEGLPILKLGSRRLRNLSWLAVADKVKSRDENKCRSHFYNVYTNANRGLWTSKERALLREGLEMFGEDHWKMAEHIGTRSPLQVAKAARYLMTRTTLS